MQQREVLDVEPHCFGCSLAASEKFDEASLSLSLVLSVSVSLSLSVSVCPVSYTHLTLPTMAVV